MLVAITGGNGFVGQLLVKKHLLLGDRVRILSRCETSFFNEAHIVVGDLTKAGDHLKYFVEGVDVLYHCAGEINDESKMYDLHVLGTSRLLAVAKENIGRWVQLSSVGVYGPPLGLANSERVVTENTIIRPNGVYEVTKAESDKLVEEACQDSSMSYSIVRPSNIFGSHMPNQSLRSLGAMIKKKQFFYIGKRGSIATYIHVDDVVEVLLRCGLDKRAEGETFNISNDCLFEEMINGMAFALGVKQPFIRTPEPWVRVGVGISEKFISVPLTKSRVDALVSRTRYSCAKLENKLGFIPQVHVPSAMGEFLLEQ